MLKKKITYTDFNGNKREENFYFNFTKAEAAELQASCPEGYAEKLTALGNAEEPNAKELIAVFKEIILGAYGIKSDDGTRFMKSKEISDGFYQTEAYSNLFFELAEKAEAAAEFINSVMPIEKPVLSAT